MNTFRVKGETNFFKACDIFAEHLTSIEGEPLIKIISSYREEELYDI